MTEKKRDFGKEHTIPAMLRCPMMGTEYEMEHGALVCYKVHGYAHPVMAHKALDKQVGGVVEESALAQIY